MRPTVAAIPGLDPDRPRHPLARRAPLGPSRFARRAAGPLGPPGTEDRCQAVGPRTPTPES